MFDKDRHREILAKILKEIYANPLLRNLLGFKGGTAALFFYDLPRLSVDLDFNLLDLDKKELVLKQIPQILEKFGTVLEATEKRFTLFFLLSYQKGERLVKVEISKRGNRGVFEPKSFLGISTLVMNKECMTAGKLSALLTRKKFAARDLFDLWFFLKNEWKISEEFLKDQTGLTKNQALNKAIKIVKNIKKNQLLSGLGELLDEKQKVLVKEKMQEELLFLLRLQLTLD